MDSASAEAAGPTSANPADFFGILYAEDFDDPAGSAADASVAAAVSAPPPITQADIDTACAAAVRDARLEWQTSREQAQLDAIASIGTMLVAVREAAERTTLAAAEGTVVTILSMVCGLLPQFGRNHGPEEVRALLARLLPTVRSKERISVRVHPELVNGIQRDLDELDGELATMVDVIAAPLERGDVKVAWENGSMTRDTRQIVQAIQDALSQLGLHTAIDAPAKRSMAYAD